MIVLNVSSAIEGAARQVSAASQSRISQFDWAFL